MKLECYLTNACEVTMSQRELEHKLLFLRMGCCACGLTALVMTPPPTYWSCLGLEPTGLIYERS